MININISKDFTDAPGARFIQDGDKSGEEFYETILKIKMIDSINKKEKLEINFDGTFGYPSSFLSEAFGRLYKNFGKDNIWNYIIIKSNEDSSIENVIKKLLKDYE